jgi:hypothetical protein
MTMKETLSEKADPQRKRDELKAKLGKRAGRNLDIVYAVCEEVSVSAGKDFSPTSIGRLTASKGGPKPNTLLSPGGKHFRELIAEWENFSGGPVGKKVIVGSASRNKIMDHITDPVLRQIVGGILRQNRELTAENNVLKATGGAVTIDMRPRIEGSVAQTVASIDVVPTTMKLLPVERESLERLFDQAWLSQQGLRVGDDGELILLRAARSGTDVLPIGFVSGLGKLLVAAR